jgi:hypothetical protein
MPHVFRKEADGKEKRGQTWVLGDGIELDEDLDGRPMLRATVGDGSVINNSFLGCACAREILFQGWQDYVVLRDVPEVAIDVADFAGVPGLLHMYREFGCAEKLRLRLQAHVIDASPGVLALQYLNGENEWRYVDDVAGPQISLGTGGLVRGNWVLAVDEVMAVERQYRFVVSGGDGTGSSRLAMVTLEWCMYALNGDPTVGGGGNDDPTGGGGDPGAPCAIVASEDFEYADLADFENTWTVFSPLDAGGTAGFDDSDSFDGGGSFFVNHVGGGPCDISATRVFSGLVPNAQYTIRVYMKQTLSYWFDSHSVTNVTGAGGFTWSAGNPPRYDPPEWTRMIIYATSTPSGTLTVQLLRGDGFPVPYNTKTWWSNLAIQYGQNC